MVINCIVRGCTSEWSPGTALRFHSFPTDIKKRNDWLANITIKSRVYSGAKICSLHFKQEDYENYKLKRKAIPCFGGNARTINSTELDMNGETVDIKCCVDDCANRYDGKRIKNSSSYRITFHMFPKDPKQRAAWIKSLGMSNCMPSNRTLICSEHFMDTDLHDTKQGIRRIKNGAVPVVNKDNLDPIAIRMCKACLCLDRKMYHISKYNLDELYQNVLGITPRSDDWLPQSICWECTARLTAAESFRANALLADALLTEESLNYDDILKIHQNYKSLKSKLGVQKLGTIQLHSSQSSDQKHCSVKSHTLDIPNNDEIEINVTKLLKDTEKYIDEENNDFIEEYSNVDQDAVKTEIDLVPPIEVDTVPAEVEVPQQNLEYQNYEDINLENEDTDAETINESISKINKSKSKVKVKGNNSTALDKNAKKLNNKVKVKKRNDAVNIGNVLAKGWMNPVVCLERMILPKLEKQVTVKRPADTVDEDAVSTKRTRRRTYDVPSMPIDENVFTIIPLKQEDLIQEVLNRKHSAKYKEAAYKCKVCFMGFPSKDKQARHAFKHTEQCGPLVCVICKVHVKSERVLRAHTKHIHLNEYRCKICPLVTRVRTVALGHMEFHAGKTYICPKCSLTFTKLTSFLNHKRLKHMSDCVCEYCGHTFISKIGVRNHKLMLHKFIDKNFALDGPYCDVCDVTFMTRQAYEKHMRLSSKHITSEDDPNRISNNPDISVWHMWNVGTDYTQPIRRRIRRRRVENNINNVPVTCEQCGLELENIQVYGKHFKSAHPGMNRTQYVSPPYICEHCGKMYTKRTTFEGHMWVHTGQKRFECDHCHKSYSMKAMLASHIKQQHQPTKRRNYTCPMCEKQFGFSYNLRRHMILHTGLRPYKCDSCEKDFPTAEQLRLHVNHVHLNKPRPKRVRRRVKKCDSPTLEQDTKSSDNYLLIVQ